MGRAGGGGGATGRATGGGGDGITIWGGAVGRGVPQYPQNLLPSGKDLWHLGHITWGMAGATWARSAGGDGGAGAGGAPACCGRPQRPQLGADAGFMLPQDAQRM